MKCYKNIYGYDLAINIMCVFLISELNLRCTRNIDTQTNSVCVEYILEYKNAKHILLFSHNLSSKNYTV